MTAVLDSSKLNGPVMWPKSLTDGSITDLSVPLALLLIDLGICPKPEDMDKDGLKKQGNEVPASVAIIEAGATQFSVAAGKFVKWAGAVLVAGGSAVTFLSRHWQNEGAAVRSAAIGGTLLVAAAALIALSIIVSSDVRARGHGAAAQYHARAQIAEAYLRGAVQLASTAPSVAGQPVGAIDKNTLAILVGALTNGGIRVRLKNGDSPTADGFRFHDGTGEIEVHCGSNDWRVVSEIKEFESLQR